MKICSILVLLTLVLGIPVLAADKPPMDLPLYPGGESTMELNLTNEDILPMVKTLIPMLAGKMGAVADKINPDDIAAILADVKRIEFQQVDITKAVTENDVADYYAKSVPNGDWNRVFWQKNNSAGTIAVFVQGGGEAIYGFRVQSLNVDNKPVKRVMVAKSIGKIDYTKLITLASKFFQ